MVPSFCRFIFFYSFKACIKSLPGRNFTEVRGLIMTGVPVLGLRAGRPVCFQGNNTPKLWKRISSPLSSASVATLSSDSIVFLMDTSSCPESLAILRIISSFLITDVFIELSYTVGCLFGRCRCRKAVAIKYLPKGYRLALPISLSDCRPERFDL